MAGALGRIRICDFTGQLAGAGATKWMAAFGADVIRIEDPVMQGTWDILRAMPPFVDERRGVDFGGGFNNHNVGKRGITLNLRTDKGKALLAEIVRRSDVVAENFAAGVLERWGFGYDRLRELKPDIVYVSNCGFGHTGPYATYKTWGPIVQAISGLTFTSGLPDEEPAGWGYSYMDHMGANVMATAILLALLHRVKTGEGQWVDLSCTEAGLSLTGPAILDWSVNGRPMRRAGSPHSNRSEWPAMAPHGIYPAHGEDEWVAIACRNDVDWAALAPRLGASAGAPGFATLEGRLADQDALDECVSVWTRTRDKLAIERELLRDGIPAGAVRKPGERIGDETTRSFGLWPSVRHSKMGDVPVDGLPVHFSQTDWQMERGGPCIGEHTDEVLRELLGLDNHEIAQLRAEGVV